METHNLAWKAIKLNLALYTRCITQKRVTSLRGPSPRHCTRTTQLLLKKCRRDSKPFAGGNTVSDITGPRYEPQTFRSRDECVEIYLLER